MRGRACIPVWSYDEAFYASLLEGTKMAIRTDPTKGKGLFACQPIVSGELIHHETALVCSQNMDDAVAGIPLCRHCLRSLETPRRVVGRVCRSKKTALALPFGKLLAPETPVDCVFARNGCTTQFCSARCRETAWNSYHSVLCQGRMEDEEQKHAYEAFFHADWVQNGVDYSDTAMVALRIVGQFLARHRQHHLSLESSFLPFAQLIKAPIDKFYFTYLLKVGEDEEAEEDADTHALDHGVDANKDTLQRETDSNAFAKEKKAYDEVLAVQQDPLSSELIRKNYVEGGRTKSEFMRETVAMVHRMLAFSAEERDFLTAERWSELFGAVLLNGQERSPPSYYAMLKDIVEGALREVGGEETFKAFEEVVKQSHPSVDLDDLSVSTRGQGIYTVGCLYNHSCDPNLQVIYSNTNDETLSVMALRDIAVGEELCISYIEESMCFAKRQEQLYQHYLFECRCPKCTKEIDSFR